MSSKKVDASSAAYQAMNLLGALGVGANVYVQRAWPALALQVIWGVIAILSLLRARRTRPADAKTAA